MQQGLDRQIQIPIRVGRIIVMALGFGLVVCTVVLGVLRSSGGLVPPDDENLSRMLLIALGVMGAVLLPLAFFLPSRLAAQALKRKDEAKAEVKEGFLPREMMTATMIGAALAEGWGLFGAVVYFLSGASIALFAPAIGLAMIAAHMPSQEKAMRVFEHAP